LFLPHCPRDNQSQFALQIGGRNKGMRNAVKVAFQVSIHHMGIAFLQVLINFPQPVFAAYSGSETVARR
jgi:hypothetical protein